MALLSDARAQVATYTYTPQLPPHSNPFPPWFSAVNTPQLGTTFRLSVPALGYGCACYPSYFLLTGFSNPQFDMTVLGPTFRGVLMSSGEIVIGRDASVGPNWYFDMVIPNDPALAGVRFHQQVAYLFVSPTYGNSIMVGRGGHGTIGT